MDAAQFEIVWWWHFAELAVWIMMVAMFRAWWKGESRAERQRNQIREKLMDAIGRVIDTQTTFADRIAEIDHKLDMITGRK